LTTWWQLKKGGGHLVRRAVLVEFVCSPAKGYVAVPIRLPTGELTGYIRITEVTLPKEFHLSNVVTFSQEDGIKKSPAFRGAFSYLFTHAGARTGAIRRLVPNEYTYRAKYFFVIRSVRRRVRAKTPVQPLSVRSELTTAVPWHVSVRWASLDYKAS
jgi:hypothetical protein